MGAVNSVMTFFGFGSAEPQKVEASAKPRPAAARPRRGSEMSEIITLEPQTYADGKEVAAHYRQGVPVIVNIGGMSEADAKRINLAFDKGQRVGVSTANGQVVGHMLRLQSVKLGDVQVYDVPAIVLPQAMPFVLLGNSFLTRFQMLRQNDQLTLERRY